MVASIVGQGHVRAQVTAEMNYTHTTSTSEDYNPDSKVVRSTQTVEQNASDSNASGSGAVSVASALPGQQAASGADNGKSSSGRTEETTNYEISKTVTTSASEGKDGNMLKRLSIAVAVDGTVADGGAYKPRNAQELKQIDTLVKSAIGYDASRGDQVQVVNMPFARVETIVGTPAPTPFLGLDGAAWFKIIEAAILSITALLIGLFVMRPLIARMFAPVSFASAGGQIASGTPAAGQLAAPGAQGAEAQAQQGQAPAQIPPPRRESMIDISQIEGQVRESSVKKVGEVVQSHPEEALAILRTWLHQPV
jgi:flagellar M-ring protein FliF